MSRTVDNIDAAHERSLGAALKSLRVRARVHAGDQAVRSHLLERAGILSKPIADLRADRARWAKLGQQFV